MTRRYTISQHVRVMLLVIFLVPIVVWPLAAYAATWVDGDFSLSLKVNGDDVSELETIVIDPEGDLTIDLYISDVTREITLDKVSVLVTFAGQKVTTLSEDLGSFRICECKSSSLPK